MAPTGVAVRDIEPRGRGTVARSCRAAAASRARAWAASTGLPGAPQYQRGALIGQLHDLRWRQQLEIDDRRSKSARGLPEVRRGRRACTADRRPPPRSAGRARTCDRACQRWNSRRVRQRSVTDATRSVNPHPSSTPTSANTPGHNTPVSHRVRMAARRSHAVATCHVPSVIAQRRQNVVDQLPGAMNGRLLRQVRSRRLRPSPRPSETICRVANAPISTSSRSPMPAPPTTAWKKSWIPPDGQRARLRPLGARVSPPALPADRAGRHRARSRSRRSRRGVSRTAVGFAPNLAARAAGLRHAGNAARPA